MRMDAGDARFAGGTEQTIVCHFRLANPLGHGIVEKIAETPSPTRCGSPGSASSRGGESASFCDDVIVGELTAGLLAEHLVIVEPKVAGALSDMHLPQCRPAYRRLGAGGPDRENHPASSPLIPRHPH
jgi:hypothetical protein